jgi:oligosaccharide repeat unit polymerase
MIPARRFPALSLAHPAVIYALVWGLAIGLLRLRWTPVLLPLSARVFWLVSASVAAAVVMGVAAVKWWPIRPVADDRRRAELDLLQRWIRIVTIVWAVGTIFEIIIGRGVPLQWLAMGDHSRDYRDFGISTLHGLLMSLYFFLVTGMAIEWWIGGRPRAWLLLAWLTWPVIMINRAAIMWALLQVIAVFLLTKERLKWRSVAALVAVALGFLWLFGAVGTARAPAVPAALRAETTTAVAANLPIGYLWAYVYVTTPINNLVYGTTELQPLGKLHFSVEALVPTVIRTRIFDLNKRFPLQMADPRFNTATWYAAFVADFGFAGGFIASALFLLIATGFYHPARAGAIWAILGYSACFQAMALSMFTDTFTSLVCVAQLLMAVAFRASISRSNLKPADNGHLK